MFLRALSSRMLLTWLAIIVVIAALIGFFSARHLPNQLAYYRERIEFALNPSADLAYQFGMRHFNPSISPEAYSTDYTEYFLKQALAIDENHGRANQQLARIKFLRGDFNGALVNINKAVEQLGDESPSAYYVRALIRGYQADYKNAAVDFEHFVHLNPSVWAGYNDLAWVLLKSGDYEKAVSVLSTGVGKFPDNAWLLNSYATALYESGDTAAAQSMAERAATAVAKLTPQEWSIADPGNDPRIANQGLETFRGAVSSNLEKIKAGASPNTIQLTR